MPFSVPNFRDFGLRFGLQNWHQKAGPGILAFSWRSWALLDRPWGVLGGSWGVLGPFPGDPEALLGRSWRVLGAFLERPGAFLKRFAGKSHIFSGSLWFC